MHKTNFLLGAFISYLLYYIFNEDEVIILVDERYT